MNEVHQFDRRDLLIWGVDIKDPVFLEEYLVERKFWEGNGKKKGALPDFILYGFAKKYAKPVESDATSGIVSTETPDSEPPVEKRGPGRPRKELQTA